VTLTDGEKRVLKYMSLGYTTGEIAIRTGLTKKGIEYHRQRLIKKLGTNQLAIIAQFAILTGWGGFSRKAIELAAELGESISPEDAVMDRLTMALARRRG